MMARNVQVCGHPVHPIVLVFPLGWRATSVMCDLASVATDMRACLKGRRSAFVNRLGIGVAPRAHMHAPSSLSGRPARD